MRKIYFFLVMLFAVNGVWGQTTYTWNQTGSASWAISTNWTPDRTTPATNDILVFDNAATTTVTAVPTQTIGQLLVSNSTTVNLQGAAAATVLTVGGGTGTDLSVASGSALNINVATNTTTIALLTGATGSISGNMSFTSAAHKLTAVDASAVTFQNGSVFTTGTGFTSNAFGITNINSIVFTNGSIYAQGAGSNPFGASQPNSVVVFQTGSLFRLIANLAPSFSGRTYPNLEINAAGFSQSPTGTNPLTIDNLIITDGILNINLTSIGAGGVNIKGNITVAAGKTLTFNPAVAVANSLTFNGTAAQTITNAGTLTFGANEPVVIANASGVTFNNAQTISGSMTINAGALLATSAALTISGTKTFNGSFKLNEGGSLVGVPTYGASSTLIYAGTTLQTSSATEFPAASGPNSLTINNSAGVTLAFARTIAGDLTLTNGILNTTGVNLLTVIGTGAGGGGSSNSHINGPLAKTGSTDYLFPIGNGTVYRPISVSSLSGSATITASYTQGNPKTAFGTTLAAGIDHIGVCEYWDLDDGASTETGIVGLQFGSSCNANAYVNDPATLLVAHWNGSQWDNLGTDGSATMTTVKALTASTFSPFTIGSSSNTTNPLPVSLYSFSGYKEGITNKLRWTSSSEQNNSGFEVQRSTDGVNYTALGFVNSLALGGNSTSQLNYAFTDNNITGSKQYYRLHQVNFDGNSKLSNIVLIKGDKPVSLTIDGLYPNPASTLVNVLIATPIKDKVTLVVTDIAGRKVIEQVVSIETGSNTIPVDINRLTNGTYLVKLVCSSNCESAVGKFVKQ
jgi:hypothetical protein